MISQIDAELQSYRLQVSDCIDLITRLDQISSIIQEELNKFQAFKDEHNVDFEEGHAMVLQMNRQLDQLQAMRRRLVERKDWLMFGSLSERDKNCVVM